MILMITKMKSQKKLLPIEIVIIILAVVGFVALIRGFMIAIENHSVYPITPIVTKPFTSPNYPSNGKE